MNFGGGEAEKGGEKLKKVVWKRLRRWKTDKGSGSAALALPETCSVYRLTTFLLPLCHMAADRRPVVPLYSRICAHGSIAPVAATWLWFRDACCTVFGLLGACKCELQLFRRFLYRFLISGQPGVPFFDFWADNFKKCRIMSTKTR